jgi:HEAT repeat protein
LSDGNALPYLLQATRDADPDVRYAAMAALERHAPPDLPERLVHLADDPEAWVAAQYKSLRERWARRVPR